MAEIRCTMTLQEALSHHIKQAFVTLYNTPLETVEFQATRKDFEGDITVVTFSMLRTVKMNPAQLGEESRGVFIRACRRSRGV